MNADEILKVELQQAKHDAHKAFDVLWESGGMNRTAAYKFLAARMGLSVDACHIRFFDVAQCKKVIELCRPFAAISRVASAGAS